MTNGEHGVLSKDRQEHCVCVSVLVVKGVRVCGVCGRVRMPPPHLLTVVSLVVLTYCTGLFEAETLIKMSSFSLFLCPGAYGVVLKCRHKVRH